MGLFKRQQKEKEYHPLEEREMKFTDYVNEHLDEISGHILEISLEYLEVIELVTHALSLVD